MRITTHYAILSELNARRRREAQILREMELARHTARRREQEIRDETDSDGVDDETLSQLEKLDSMVDSIIAQQREKVQGCMPVTISDDSKDLAKVIKELEDFTFFQSQPEPNAQPQTKIPTRLSADLLGELHEETVQPNPNREYVCSSPCKNQLSTHGIFALNDTAQHTPTAYTA